MAVNLFKRSAIAVVAVMTTLVVAVSASIVIKYNPMDKLQRWMCPTKERSSNDDKEVFLDLELGGASAWSFHDPGTSASTEPNTKVGPNNEYEPHTYAPNNQEDETPSKIYNAQARAGTSKNREQPIASGSAGMKSADVIASELGMTSDEYKEYMKRECALFKSNSSDSSHTQERKRIAREEVLLANQELGIEAKVEIDLDQPFSVEEYRSLFCKHKIVGDPDVEEEYKEHMEFLASGRHLLENV